MPRHPDTVVEPNAQLANARRRLRSRCRPGQRMSRPELADAVNTALDRLYPHRDLTAQYADFRWVGKLERGDHRWPSEERRHALRQVLEVHTDAEIGLYSPRRSPDKVVVPPRLSAPRRDPIGARTDIDENLILGTPDTVDAWMHQLDRLVRSSVHGVRSDLLARVQGHLNLLDHLQRDRVLPHLVRVDARWSEFMSWLADNAGGPGGDVWLERSHQRAEQADDQILSAYTRMRQSQRALDAGDIRTAIVLSRQALTYGPVPARTRVLCLIRSAESLAAGGDADAYAVLTTARRALHRFPNDPADEFAKHCDLNYLTAADARCRLLLGDAASAAAILTELHARRRPAPPVDAALWQVYAAECHLLDDPEQAAHHGSTALRIASDVGSHRVVRASQPLAIALRRHSGLTAVDEFVRAHRRAVTGR
jgi:hypothetical protein